MYMYPECSSLLSIRKLAEVQPGASVGCLLGLWLAG